MRYSMIRSKSVDEYHRARSQRQIRTHTGAFERAEPKTELRQNVHLEPPLGAPVRTAAAEAELMPHSIL